ncbi:MAG: proton-conducting membrane transporter, partial [Oscillibacter sp.]|nr:proton-conducting membrane transporter [Oscillibacter sp.]
MSPALLLLPILFPILSGGALLLYPNLPDRKRNRYVEAAACANSALTLLLLSGLRPGSDTVYSFIDGFSLSFHADGCARLFAGMLVFMWPLALLYAFDYMEHAPRKNSFFAFYLMTYGVALGVAFAANL